jgi:signal peptidase I
MASLWRGLGWTAAIVAVIGGVGRAVFFDSWVLPDDDKTSASVAPTLTGGDTVLFMKQSRPGFGDLVRCVDPDDAAKFVIGRVVGLAGDVVDTDGRELRVNGTRYLSERVCTQEKVQVPHPSSGALVDVFCDVVSIGGHPHFRGTGQKASITTPTHHTVGEGKLFLLSDDRTYHDDSRDFGAVPASSCSGRIVFRLWGKDGWKDEKRRMTAIQ